MDQSQLSWITNFIWSIADDVLRALAAAEPPGRVLVVATSDQQVVADVRRVGAWTVPSAGLLTLLG